MCFALYRPGMVTVICGPAQGAYLIHIPPQWIGVGIVVLPGLGILTGVAGPRQKDPPG